jgi:hypothetical protein
MRLLAPLVALATGGLLVAATLIAQDQDMMPRPAPEHAQLKQRAGTWSADMKMKMGAQEITDKGTLTYTMLGDFWVIGDYEGHYMGMPFKGHEVSGWDPETKQYVSYWMDSGSAEVSVSHGTWDGATKTMTMSAKGKDMMTGKPVTWVKKTKEDGPDKMVMSMGNEGEEPMMEITYTRKK